MIKMFLLIFKFIGGAILFKLFALVYLMFILFIFSFGSKSNDFNKLSSLDQSVELILEKGRDSLRGFYGKIVPMKPYYFKNLSKNQIKRLPDPRKALIQLNDREMYRLQKMGNSYRKTQESFSKLFKALIEHFKS